MADELPGRGRFQDLVEGEVRWLVRREPLYKVLKENSSTEDQAEHLSSLIIEGCREAGARIDNLLTRGTHNTMGTDE